ncbi:hypothetical protein [Ferrimonas lipolytica]|uniref:Uncharacterized protein n=1 Tax=Ferrimonas lipolytica TaxID=2724191 RepID=A0A6H1U9P9_9GAMM|nr:hypothetical protein [Ferrimonas lipolytica]QIZ75754.1 hypothetical protein HER31_01865 [Ferrimonas lipolytica]
MPTILVDQNIVTYGDIMRPTRSNGVIGYRRKDPVGEDGSWLRREFRALPTVSKLIIAGDISAFRYVELDFENWKRKGSASGSNLGNLFPNSVMKQVEPAIERSYYFQAFMNEYLYTRSVANFCKWLNTKGIEESALKVAKSKNATDDMLRNIRNVSRYQEMCKKLQKTEQYIDAFHLWTAEINDIEYFVTADRKFINAINKLDCKCQPILPSELLTQMNLEASEPFQFKENVFYGIGGQYMWEFD